MRIAIRANVVKKDCPLILWLLSIVTDQLLSIGPIVIIDYTLRITSKRTCMIGIGIVSSPCTMAIPRKH